MPTYEVTMRDAKRTNGHASEEPVTGRMIVRGVVDWFHARETAAKSLSLDPWDSAILAVRVDDDSE